LSNVFAFEVVLHRMVWSLLFLVCVLAVLKHWAWLRELLRQPRVLAAFALSALQLSTNWSVYVWAVALRTGSREWHSHHANAGQIPARSSEPSAVRHPAAKGCATGGRDRVTRYSQVGPFLRHKLHAFVVHELLGTHANLSS
jgi:hypothetical protein